MFSYYVENRLVELKHSQQHELQYKDNIKLSDSEYEKMYNANSDFDINKFLEDDEYDNTRFILAPFGNGKTTFAKHIVKQYIEKFHQPANTKRWLPIYIPLKAWPEVFPNMTLEKLIKDIIKPTEENIFVICDGLDEYSKDKKEVLEQIDKLMSKHSNDNDDENGRPNSFSINDYKKIVTTRPEAHFPFENVQKFARLLPFSENEVDLFFSRYGLPQIKWDHLKRYNFKDKENDDDLLRKPLFCWMFAFSFTRKDLDLQENEKNFQVLLYSSFIHSIIDGRPLIKPETIHYEKWILRKIAALKAIYKELTIDLIKEKLKVFAQGEESNEQLLGYVNEKNEDNLIDPILTSYFKFSEVSSKQVDFLHKSFEEYLLAEYIIESIIRDKWYRLNIGIPSKVTIILLESFLDILKSDEEKYNKFKNTIFDSINFDLKTKANKDTLANKSKAIFEKGQLTINHNNLQEKELDISVTEIWKHFKYDFNNYRQSIFYLFIVLFILKKLRPEMNPNNLKKFLEDVDLRGVYNLRYFPQIDLSGTNLSNADLSDADLSNANLSGTNLSNANLSGTNLSNVNLSCADLSNANLSDANLSDANLSYTNLSYANLSYANLSYANLSYANLSNANLSNADLSNADLSGAIFEWSILFNLKYSIISELKINDKTSFKDAITNNRDFKNYLEKKILKENIPILLINEQ